MFPNLCPLRREASKGMWETFVTRYGAYSLGLTAKQVWPFLLKTASRKGQSVAHWRVPVFPPVTFRWRVSKPSVLLPVKYYHELLKYPQVYTFYMLQFRYVPGG
jgi:hypothetical protein